MLLQYGIGDVNRLIDYAFALADGYGSAAASLACQMYDNVAEASKVFVPPAEPAELASMTEVAKAVNATKSNTNMLSNAVSKYIRLAAADTMLKNAKRDKAQFAWIPSGDSCAFCLVLASNGWRNESEEVMKGNHAAHVHANCDCTFDIRFSDKLNVEGYDPDIYKKIYDFAQGETDKKKINSIRRMLNGKNSLTIEQLNFIIDAYSNPKSFFNIEPKQLYNKLKNNGFNVLPLGKGSLKNIEFEDGGGFRTHYFGDGYLQYHPDNGSHHKGEYYKTAIGEGGIHRYDTKGNEILG